MIDISSIKDNKKNKKDKFSIFALIAKLIPSGWRFALHFHTGSVSTGLEEYCKRGGTIAALKHSCSGVFNLGGGGINRIFIGFCL